MRRVTPLPSPGFEQHPFVRRLQDRIEETAFGLVGEEPRAKLAEDGVPTVQRTFCYHAERALAHVSRTYLCTSPALTKYVLDIVCDHTYTQLID